MEKAKVRQRTRRWVFTLNNPTQEPDTFVSALWESVACRYLIIGDEVAPETGTRHFQGFVEFENAATFDQVRQRLAGAHIEPAQGSNKQNVAYCSKSDNFVERGKQTRRVQGSEEAAEVVRYVVVEAVHPARLAVDYPEFATYVVNHFHALLAMWRENVEVSIRTPSDEQESRPQ